MQPQTEISQNTRSTYNYSENKFNHRSLWIVVAVFLLICTGFTYAAYTWQHSKVKSLNSQISVLETKAKMSGSNIVSVTKGSAVSTYSTNVAVSYPLSLTKKKVLTTLYVPSGNSILQTAVRTTTQDELIAHYVESFNDIMVNWEFSNTGTASSPSDSSSNNMIEIDALNDWASKNDPSTVSYGPGYSPTSGAMTIVQKATFIADLKKQSASCATDSSKGFSTLDGKYNICITLIHPQAQDAGWGLELSGYAEIEGTFAYLRGGIELPNSYQAELSNYINALKNITTEVKDNNY